MRLSLLLFISIQVLQLIQFIQTTCIISRMNDRIQSVTNLQVVVNDRYSNDLLSANDRYSNARFANCNRSLAQIVIDR